MLMIILLALPQSARGDISGARSWRRGWGHCSPTVAVPRAAKTAAAFHLWISTFFPFRQHNHQLSSSATQTGRTNTRTCRTALGKAGLGPVCCPGSGACWAPSGDAVKTGAGLKCLTCSPPQNTWQGKNPLTNTQVSPNCKRPSMQFFFCRLWNQVGSLRSTTKVKRYIEEWHYMYENMYFCPYVSHGVDFIPHCYR